MQPPKRELSELEIIIIGVDNRLHLSGKDGK